MKTVDACVLPMPGLEADNLLALLATLGLLRSLEASQPPVASALAAALSAECPLKEDGRTNAAPLVMLFGQGHQHFLDRLVSVPQGDLPGPLRKLKKPPDLRSPSMIAGALFAPWKRSDATDAFRWDPEEDQRYALRFGDPSRAGAALTVHGANRLAAIGLLSFPCMPTKRRLRAAGSDRTEEGVVFLWPIWTSPFTRRSIEDLLVHPALLRGDRQALAAFSVREIFRARRIANGKFMNVTRATPVAPLEEVPARAGRRRS